ncbi:hypothetical protein ABW20_dc0101697 [Dactylellina cionopaga]|nr:hypothetical protein ABW20_dc0101697 [Dactylellina cionopaga]
MVHWPYSTSPDAQLNPRKTASGDLEKNMRRDNEPERKRPKFTDVPLGYSRVAAYVDGHEDTPIFRRFGILKARVLLTQQAELEEKERQLERIDAQEAEIARQRGQPDETDNYTWLMDQNTRRKELIRDIAERLRRYGKEYLAAMDTKSKQINSLN